MHAALGIDRGFAVHANTHGFDNSVDIDAAQRSGGRYVAVVRLDHTATVQNCRDMHEQGVRGVRFAFNPQHGGTLDRDVFNHVQGCIEDLGWFVELHFAGAALPVLQRWIESMRCPVVIDHFGRIDPEPGLDQKPFRALAALAARSNVWIKITGADRLSRQGPPYADVVPFAHELVRLAADRLLWGTDWPHTGYFDPASMPDAGVLLDALYAFVPQDDVRERILVRNPARLIGQK
jgi:predicted TIM-barrel fold metal-dependent hydrolase